jgi:hypothetical protein
MIDGYSVYKLFIATKLHFTNEKYDLVKYKGNLSGVSQESYNNRKDRKLFEHLGRQFKTRADLIQFFVANFAYGNDSFVWDFKNGISERNYHKWIKTKESLINVFSDDLSFILLETEKHSYTYSQLFGVSDDTYPLVLSWYLSCRISIETMSLLNQCMDLISTWQPLILLWSDHFLRIQRVEYFIKCNKEKILMIHKNFIENIETYE